MFGMYTVRLLPDFSDWLEGLKDGMTRRRLGRRLEKAAQGNWGDVKAVDENVWEMRKFFGPGWRMYYTRRKDDALIVMLAGGDKSTQSADVARAIELALALED
jgi:putative addiction module killer protein